MHSDFYILSEAVLSSEKLKKLCSQFGNNFYLQWRAKNLSLQTFLTVSKSYINLCQTHDVKLFINHPNSILATGFFGHHLTSSTLHQSFTSSFPSHCFLSASCHNQKDIEQAERLGIHLVLLSPILATKTHPDTIPLGWEKASYMARSTSLRVYFLGGLKPSDLKKSKSMGAFGVSGMRGFL